MVYEEDEELLIFVRKAIHLRTELQNEVDQRQVYMVYVANQTMHAQQSQNIKWTQRFSEESCPVSIMLYYVRVMTYAK